MGTAAEALPRQRKTDPQSAVSLSEVVAALSYALDLTEGQPRGHAVRSCLIGMRLARELGLDGASLSSLYYGFLLKDVGCSSNAAGTSSLFGADDRSVKRNLKVVDWSRVTAAGLFGLRNAGTGGTVGHRWLHLLKFGLVGRHRGRAMFRIRCERGAEIVTKLGFPPDAVETVRALDEHWDGAGHPYGRCGTDIPLGARIACLAQTMDVFGSEGGAAAAIDVAMERSGRWFDPDLVRIVASWQRDEAWWNDVYGPDAEKLAVEAEPADGILWVDDAGLNRVAEAFADVIDAKSPYTYHHSSGVARYARLMSEQLDLPYGERVNLYRAGLLHDIGKLGVSNRVLDKQGRLTRAERKLVENHPVYTWSILSRVRVFREIARTASLHHERLDGSGYPWGLAGDDLDRSARVLQVADVYEALTADRPYRGPLAPRDAISIMRRDSGTRLDSDALAALEAAVLTS